MINDEQLLIDAIKNTFIGCLKGGMSIEDAFAECRDTVSRLLQISLLSAANFMRLIVALVEQDYGHNIYTRDEIDTIYSLIK